MVTAGRADLGVLATTANGDQYSLRYLPLTGIVLYSYYSSLRAVRHASETEARSSSPVCGLRQQQLERGHRDHPRRDAAFRQLLLGGHRDLDLGAGGDVHRAANSAAALRAGAEPEVHRHDHAGGADGDGVFDRPAGHVDRAGAGVVDLDQLVQAGVGPGRIRQDRRRAFSTCYDGPKGERALGSAFHIG